MTQEEFAELYEQYQKPALNIMLSKFQGNRDLADDALQDAAEYFLGRLDTLNRITEAYFVRCCVDRAKNIQRGRTRQYMRALPEGIGNDLEIVEEQELKAATGRKYVPGSLDDNSRPDQGNWWYDEKQAKPGPVRCYRERGEEQPACEPTSTST